MLSNTAYEKVKKLADGSYETEDVEGHTEKLLENLILLERYYGVLSRE